MTLVKKLIKQLVKPKPIAYFKTEYNRYGGNHQNITRYLKVMDDGAIKVIDTTRLKTSTIRSFGGMPMKLFKSNKREWDRAFLKLKNNF